MRDPKQWPFFAYGTLLPGQPNFHLWEAEIAYLEPATLQGGKLHDMGFYPMCVGANEEDVVQGMVVGVRHETYAAVKQRLDALEGYDPKKPGLAGYQRRLVEVILTNGRSQSAWIYQGQRELVHGMPEVPNGDWVAYAADNMLSLQAWWTTVQSVAGRYGNS